MINNWGSSLSVSWQCQKLLMSLELGQEDGGEQIKASAGQPREIYAHFWMPCFTGHQQTRTYSKEA